MTFDKHACLKESGVKLKPLALGGASLLEVLTTEDCVRVLLCCTVVNLWCLLW